MKKMFCFFVIILSQTPLFATTEASRLRLFRPSISSNGLEGEAVTLVNSKIEIQIDGFFAAISVEWEFESESVEKSAVMAAFRLPSSAVLDRFQWERNGKMIDATPTLDVYAADSFDLEHMLDAPVASLSGKQNNYSLRIYPVSKGHNQRVRIHCVMPVPLIDGFNQFAIPGEAFWFKGTADIEITIPDVDIKPHFLNLAKMQTEEHFDEDGWHWKGRVDQTQKKAVHFVWRPPEGKDRIMIVEKGGEWLFAIREALGNYPQFRTEEMPRSSKKSLIFLGPIDLEERKNRCFSIAKYLSSYLQNQTVTIVAVHKGQFAEPVEITLDYSGDKQKFSAALFEASNKNVGDHHGLLPANFLDHDLVWLFLEKDQMPPQWPTIPDNVGTYFDPTVLFGEEGAAHFGNAIVWDGQAINRLSPHQSFRPQILIHEPNTDEISGSLITNFFIPEIYSETSYTYAHYSRKVTVPQILVLGRLAQRPPSLGYSWPGMLEKKTVPVQKNTFARTMALERWMFPAGFTDKFATKENTHPTYSFKNGGKRDEGFKVGFLAFDRLEKYREYWLGLPGGDRFPSEVHRQFQQEMARWPTQRPPFQPIRVSAQNSFGTLKLKARWNEDAIPSNEKVTMILSSTKQRSEIQFFNGEARIARIPTGVHDLLFKSPERHPVFIPGVEIKEGKNTQLEFTLGAFFRLYE